MSYKRGQPWSTFVGHSHTNQSLALLEEYKKSFDSISKQFSCCTGRKKGEKSPHPSWNCKNVDNIFFGAAIPPSPSSVDDKPRTFAIGSTISLLSSKDKDLKNFTFTSKAAEKAYYQSFYRLFTKPSPRYSVSIFHLQMTCSSYGLPRSGIKSRVKVGHATWNIAMSVTFEASYGFAFPHINSQIKTNFSALRFIGS